MVQRLSGLLGFNMLKFSRHQIDYRDALVDFKVTIRSVEVFDVAHRLASALTPRNAPAKLNSCHPKL